MNRQPGGKSAWDARIRQATELASIHPFAAEGLRFYAQIAMLEQKIYMELEQTPARPRSSDGMLRDQLNVSALLPKFSPFLTGVGHIAPPPLAQATRSLAEKSFPSRSRPIEDVWESPEAVNGNDETEEGLLAERCLAWLFLQPYAEYLAARQTRFLPDRTPSRCPLCGSNPIVGVLRPEGDGASKSLICMLCAHEWPFRRIYCPSCGEERETNMAFYSGPEIPHVRVDVCDTCRTYLKSVDLTKTGIAVPIVDELAALVLDLWAREQVYRKLQMNVVGI